HNNLRRGVQPTAINMLKMVHNVIQSWADEVKDFQYGPVNEPVFSFCAQVVWYRSNQISCAVANCPNSNYNHYCMLPFITPFATLLHFSIFLTLSVSQSVVYFYYCLPLPANPCPYADKYTNCAEVARQPCCSNSDVTSWCPAS
uniref:ShKT domain-containing protein n=1 Tax=Hucho hucho TaxID=62062 RepID=A0A4W5P473_9TELE